MQRTQKLGRDLGLQMRMAFTMLLLTVVYLAFSFILFHVTHAVALLVIVPLAGLFFQYYFSDKIVLNSVGARMVTDREAPQLVGIIQRLAQQADVPMPRVAISQTPMPNAFATGRSPQHAVIVVTSGLLQQLTEPELAAVLGHEMTHIRNRDMVVMTMAGSFAAVAAWLTQWMFWFGPGLGGGYGGRRDNNGGAAFVMLTTVLVAIISHVLVLALSRYREYAADRGGALLTGQPEQLASALMRISGTMSRIPERDLRQAEPLSALFIAAPKREIIFELFSDHPSLEHRVARLQRLSQEMARP